MSKNNSGKIVIYRSAITGRIVSKKYADSHPKTTERENYRRKS